MKTYKTQQWDNMQIIHGDSYKEVANLKENSIDAIVCDPPYMIGFMGKEFDKPEENIAGDVKFWELCLRVLKPGGHLLAFGGTRTYHRMACAIEDAGFEVRDMVEWIYACVSEDTEILTSNGWKMLYSVFEGDYVFACDYKNDLKLQLEPVKKKYIYDYDEDAYYIKDTGYYNSELMETDHIVSKNHNVVVSENGEYPQKVTAELLFENAEKRKTLGYKSEFHIPGLNGYIPCTIEKKPYKGKMWCVEVESGAFVARRNGKIFITGNSGFPKSLNVAKAINKQDGVEFESKPAEGVGFMKPDSNEWHQTKNMLTQKGESSERAKQYQGQGTALKPAHEPIIWATKDLTFNDEYAILYSIENNLGETIWQSLEKLQKQDMSKLQAMVSIHLNIVLLWQNILAELLKKENKSTISTESKLITDLKILNFSLLKNTQESTDGKSQTLQNGTQKSQVNGFNLLANIVGNCLAGEKKNTQDILTAIAQGIVFWRQNRNGITAKNVGQDLQAIILNVNSVLLNVLVGLITNKEKNELNTLVAFVEESLKQYLAEPQNIALANVWLKDIKKPSHSPICMARKPLSDGGLDIAKTICYNIREKGLLNNQGEILWRIEYVRGAEKQKTKLYSSTTQQPKTVEISAEVVKMNENDCVGKKIQTLIESICVNGETTTHKEQGITLQDITEATEKGCCNINQTIKGNEKKKLLDNMAENVSIAEKQDLSFLPLTTSTVAETNTEKRKKYTTFILGLNEKDTQKKDLGYSAGTVIARSENMVIARTIKIEFENKEYEFAQLTDGSFVWNNNLTPFREPKPCTIVENIIKHGTGGIEIDNTKIPVKLYVELLKEYNALQE